jgi:hypothetical protein
MDDIGANERLAWMCMGTSAWSIITAMEYALFEWIHFVAISSVESEIG